MEGESNSRLLKMAPKAEAGLAPDLDQTSEADPDHLELAADPDHHGAEADLDRQRVEDDRALIRATTSAEAHTTVEPLSGLILADRVGLALVPGKAICRTAEETFCFFNPLLNLIILTITS